MTEARLSKPNPAKDELIAMLKRENGILQCAYHESVERESALVAALRESHNSGWKWVIDDALGEIERTENNRGEMQVFDAISAIVAAHDARETPVVGADNP